MIRAFLAKLRGLHDAIRHDDQIAATGGDDDDEDGSDDDGKVAR